MYQNYIFDLYGTLVDIHTNEKKAYLWKKMSLFFGMKGAAYEPKELRMAYETKIKEQEAALKMECRGSHVPEIDIADVFRQLFEDQAVSVTEKEIADLAKRMIELAGYEPDKEIKIKYTGLRPGEKLYEEVLSNEENTLPTTHQKIKVAKVREYKYANIVPELEHLALAARQIQILETVRLMKQIIPEFKSKNSCFEELDKQKESALSQSNL